MVHLHLPPELLLLVLKQVRYGEEPAASKKSLRNAILVNRGWAEAGIRVLWQDADVAALTRLPAERRQYYTNQICELSFEHEDQSKHHATFGDLSFPRLETIYVGRIDLKSDKKLHLSQYMQSQLRSFSFLGGGLCEDALDALTSTCHNLREMNLESPIDASNAKSLIGCLTHLKLLEVLRLGDGWDSLVTRELFGVVAGHERLIRLEIECLTGDSAIQEGLAVASAPFRNLRSLRMTVGSRCIEFLASATRCLRVLVLEVEDSVHDVLVSLRPLMNLVCLELTFLGNTDLSPQGFKTLEGMVDLSVLALKKGHEPLSTMWMDDTFFIDFSSKLPKLTSLDFRVICDITASSFASLCKTHPNMEDLDLWVDADFSDWSTMSTPLFPKLKKLGVYGPLNERARRTFDV
ncbi:hypothetical protein E4T38_02361 [Aureobasidium subglaciale]|nr:hypothetical protein E4T38_02361 [Aureobasidium subglaciale]KAI5228470.1 hypothetical protein E4T40_02140 [Aureobasidium subglaciale]KAI5232027.1 hypothetical protein E4T41_02360 [Aureobasidium subglaciale]KAI5265766.1 hypothetical protein E4T46_02138 [Aureobasidium subglaciale]